ncbi:MAG: hypothetical protein KJ574_04850 [Nanoarchaeota archaeon]|nr:hypothetical protein [Nanoarchaeota archaeon]
MSPKSFRTKKADFGIKEIAMILVVIIAIILFWVILKQRAGSILGGG